MRGEKITTIFINNAIYGMTSGQMAPTTLINQVTTTSPFGRKPELHGYPLKVMKCLLLLRALYLLKECQLMILKIY